jgi:hypothetical protein
MEAEFRRVYLFSFSLLDAQTVLSIPYARMDKTTTSAIDPRISVVAAMLGSSGGSRNTPAQNQARKKNLKKARKALQAKVNGNGH